MLAFAVLRPPQSCYEAIDILDEHKVLEPEFAFSFAKIAGFRNFLAHDYKKIAESSICNSALSKHEEIEGFLRQIESSLGLKL
ncbi:MAG: DUF86 domain-containing protein [Planctomycetes bacterium]|nr:DUF86 domain-containing protein [Planctomycetota bacterium]